MMPHERCEFCRFWASAPQSSAALAGGKLTYAPCRRYAPVVDHGRPDGIAWPVTNLNDWCGDFEYPRIPEYPFGDLVETPPRENCARCGQTIEIGNNTGLCWHCFGKEGDS